MYGNGMGAAQFLSALDEANRVRIHRATVKRNLRARRVGLASVIDDPDFKTVEVAEVIASVDGYGPLKSRQLMAACRIRPGRVCAALTPKQRAGLFAELGSLTQRDDS